MFAVLLLVALIYLAASVLVTPPNRYRLTGRPRRGRSR